MIRTPDGRRLVELAEWKQSNLVSDVSLSDSDDALLQSLSGEDEGAVKLRTHWNKEGEFRAESRSWVGVVRVADLEIRIVPKLAGSAPGVAKMLHYARRAEAIARLPSAQFVETGDPNLLDLVCWLLADEAARILGLGVLSDYVEKEETIGMLRGRLRVLDQVRHQFGRVDRLECRFDEFETDILENRIVAAGLRVARRVASQPRIRHMVEMIEPIFAELCSDVPLDPDVAERQLIPTRRNQIYRGAHLWALLLLRSRAISNIYASGPAESFAFLIDMNPLFEDFVEVLLRDALEGTGYRVRSQRRTRSILVDEASQPYRDVIPDLLIGRRSGHAELPVDTKYKLYEDRKVDPSDIYQTFLYAYAFAPDRVLPAAAIVYPATADLTAPVIRVENREGVLGARLTGVAVDLLRILDRLDEPTPGAELAQRLLALLEAQVPVALTSRAS
jgi:5-methylcytosine-specific restriction enzyme subunit McrC